MEIDGQLGYSTFGPRQFTPGHLSPANIKMGLLAPGHLSPGLLTPKTFGPWDIWPPGKKGKNGTFVPRYFWPPGQLSPVKKYGALKWDFWPQDQPYSKKSYVQMPHIDSIVLVVTHLAISQSSEFPSENTTFPWPLSEKW